MASAAWGGKRGGVSSEEPGGLAHGRHGHADREGSAIASLLVSFLDYKHGLAGWRRRRCEGGTTHQRNKNADLAFRKSRRETSARLIAQRKRGRHYSEKPTGG